MSSSSKHGSLFAVVAVALAALAAVEARPSHPFAFHGLPDHFDALPPVFPPAHFHAVAPPPPALPVLEPASLPLPVPAPFHPTLFAAPAPLPAPLPLPAALPVPAPLPTAVFTAPAPLPAPIPAPVFAPAPALPLAKFLPPVLEALPFALHAPPTYRAIPGPKTTTHHVSVGYAFPAPAPVAKLVSSPILHSHLAPAPLAFGHHHHHSLF